MYMLHDQYMHKCIYSIISNTYQVSLYLVLVEKDIPSDGWKTWFFKHFRN